MNLIIHIVLDRELPVKKEKTNSSKGNVVDSQTLTCDNIQKDIKTGDKTPGNATLKVQAENKCRVMKPVKRTNLTRFDASDVKSRNVTPKANKVMNAGVQQLGKTNNHEFQIAGRANTSPKKNNERVAKVANKDGNVVTSESSINEDVAGDAKTKKSRDGVACGSYKNKQRKKKKSKTRKTKYNGQKGGMKKYVDPEVETGGDSDPNER